MASLVYLVGGPDVGGREDLRYSLRSFAANASAITDVWVVGDTPSWLAPSVHTIPLPPQPEKFANMRASLDAFLRDAEAPAEFYLANDDHYLMEAVTGQLPTFHLGPTADFVAARPNSRNTWLTSVRLTAEWMERHGYPDPLLYEAHTPLLYGRDLLRVWFDRYPEGRRLAYPGLYPAAGIGGVGVNAGNAKVRPGDDLAAKAAQQMPFLSGNDEVWFGPFGDLIRSTFPTPCRYEAGH